MRLDMRVLEVDPIHRRIVLAVTNIPEDQPPRPETPPRAPAPEADDAVASSSEREG
jgi:small subunit ribosomal protein S1